MIIATLSAWERGPATRIAVINSLIAGEIGEVTSG